MPPRASLTSSFSVTDVNNEVVCPLRNQDGTACRKRCLGEKRYRSMQEHIRRAHPEYYLPKLPATKESFELMINTPPHERPAIDPNHANQNRSHHNQHHNQHQQAQQSQAQQHHLQHSDPSGLSPAFVGLDHPALNSSFEGYHHPHFGQHDGGYYTAGDTEAAAIYHSMQAQQRDEYRRGSLIPAASAAAALASLHYQRPDSEWGGDHLGQNFYADQSHDLKTNHHFHVDPALDDPAFLPDHGGFPVSSSTDQPSLMPSSIARSPPDRPSTLPPLQRSASRQYNRPRKSSLTQQARLSKHERKRSKELARRHSGGGRLPDPSSLLGKRWEDLIDAAASATEEEGSRDLTPIPASPYQSPQVPSRTSLPPFAMGSQFQSYQASPLNRALTPPAADANLELQPFSSIDSSLSSTNISHQHHNSAGSTGSQFHIMNPNSLTSPSESSPIFNPADPAAAAAATANMAAVAAAAAAAAPPSGPVRIYCAGCRKLSSLKDSYACTNCICGICVECVNAIMEEQSRGRMSMCPRCNAMDSQFKQFQLDIR